MSEYWLSDKPGHVRETARLELQALSLFPADECSQRQALLLLQDEYQRHQKIGSLDYQPSELVRSLIVQTDKRIAHRFITGLVAIAMTALDNAGRPMSLESAAAIVSEYSNTVGKTPFAFWREGNWVEEEKRLLGDLASVKKVFRANRSVAHICAAGISTSEYLGLLRPFETSQAADACFVSTVMYYQIRLREASRFKDWNMVEIKLDAPSHYRDCPPLPASDDALANLLGPWLDTQRT